MILALATTDTALARTVVEYLSKRSVQPVDLSNEPTPGAVVARLEALDPMRHYVVTGVDSADSLTFLRGRDDFRLLFLGPPPTDEDPLAELHRTANDHLHAEGPETLTRVQKIALEAMAAFSRPDWDDYFMQIAHVVARRANCMKRKVAAVVVRDHRIVATGYNGTPRGARNCNEGGCPRCNTLTPAGTDLEECMCNHAEENAITQAAFHGISVRDATLYCTFSPCLHCTKLIINAGIREVVYNARYPMGDRALELLAECGVLSRRYEG